MTTENESAAVELLGALLSCDPKKGVGCEELFDTLTEMDVESMASQWPYLPSEDVAPLLRELQRGAAADRDELARSYRRLFVGPQVLAAPPYGSVYTDRDMVVFGEATLVLRAWLRRVGIGVSDLDGAPEDHIATMLSLLGWMLRVKPQRVDEYLQGHLLTWAPHYLDLLEEAADDESAPFYRCIAKLTRETLRAMQRDREIEVALPRFYR